MSTNLVRMKFAAVAAKIEVAPGTDAIGGTPAAADWIASEMEVQFDPTIIELPELTGSEKRTVRPFPRPSEPARIPAAQTQESRRLKAT